MGLGGVLPCRGNKMHKDPEVGSGVGGPRYCSYVCVVESESNGKSDIRWS